MALDPGANASRVIILKKPPVLLGPLKPHEIQRQTRLAKRGEDRVALAAMMGLMVEVAGKR